MAVPQTGPQAHTDDVPGVHHGRGGGDGGLQLPAGVVQGGVPGVHRGRREEEAVPVLQLEGVELQENPNHHLRGEGGGRLQGQGGQLCLSHVNPSSTHNM